MIAEWENTFLLGGEGWSCLLRIDPYGQLEQLHFGAPVQMEDWTALRPKPGLGWGTAIQLDEEDPESCPDAAALGWSGAGWGDYRESPIELESESGPLDSGFFYEGHTIHSGAVRMDCSLPQSDGGDMQTLEIRLRQRSGLLLRLYFTAFEDALVRRTVLENESGEPVFVRKLMSLCADLPGEYEMTTLDGGWIAEAHPHRTPVGPARVVNESATGFSSNRHNPGFLLSEPGASETKGTVYGFNLLYSGNHYASAQRSLQGLTRVMQGISPAHFRKAIAPGEKFEAPEAVMAWSDKGFGGLSERMHRLVNRRIVPPYWRGRPRPVLYNSWEGCMFDFDQNLLTDLARKAAALGCELFVLDDGWFGARKDDRAGLGDYTVNRRKLRGGLKALAERINRLGMDFGLWFEPEAVNEDSALFRAHPDWVLGGGSLPPLKGRHEWLLDLRLKQVRDYIVNAVGEVLDSAPIRYVKWDMNRHSQALGVEAHDYILGLYEVLERIFGPRPEILLESCASGGNRFDLGMLCYSPQIWCSDDTDPIERLKIQGGLSYLYPQSVMGTHVSASPHAQTLRTTPLPTRGNLSFFGLLGYELDLRHLLPVEKREIAAQIAYYKAHRMLFQFGCFRRLETEEGTAWQVGDRDHLITGLFHALLPAAPGYERLRPYGLEEQEQYRVCSRPQALRVGPFGGLLRHISPVPINPNGSLLRLADRHYTLGDGGESFCASGAALMAGWMLSPRFSGTGYRKDLRMQGDFGSIIYEIRKVQEDEGYQSEE